MRFRLATPDDAPALRDLERDANLVALEHVFGDTPFPEAAVLARWSAELADPTFRVHVVDGPGVSTPTSPTTGRCCTTSPYTRSGGAAGWGAPPSRSRSRR